MPLQIFVRLGIGFVQVDSAAMIQRKINSMEKLKTRVAQIKLVPKGHAVGYSRKGLPIEIKKWHIGYWLCRWLRQKNGKWNRRSIYCRPAGSHYWNVCMDMCMVDITEIDNVNEEDECEIYGKRNFDYSRSKNIGTIPYSCLPYFGKVKDCII